MQSKLCHRRTAFARTICAVATILIGAVATSVAASTAGAIVVAQADEPTGQGTLNTIDTKARKLNITHGPIAALNWPGMTMNFGVAPGIDLGSLKPGSKISFTLNRGVDGVYVIDAIRTDE
ncbi:copper-binding protein [Rhodoblastus acidophilus]|uniref:Copper-binding protein n=1 Tax=Candidatus Rhodoblastus alkanivorans TaxID=2954117 RepID=A0ABS9Z4I4_9HYPH|nr:copper-binding protein [Candidatus Rhodoblastus alkanivorans]MCI4677362.1 copper-binding protein [Candidatus Rhodoblastus alkanivorans]MCI4682097.1 copper-binding protein [Candidatus Rhodoblastus alkanivorans]MDI4639399.1 copper-binding protein [Rhodoblastus acidophilus]